MPPRPTDLFAPAAPITTAPLPRRDSARDEAPAPSTVGDDDGRTLALVLAEEAAADPAFAGWLAGGARSVGDVIARLRRDDPAADAVVRSRRWWRALLVEDLAVEELPAPPR